MTKDDRFMESALRELRAAPVPDDLFARLATAEPEIPVARPRRGWHLAGWGGLAMAAACALFAFRVLPTTPVPAGESVAVFEPAREIHHEARLLDQRVLAVIHRDGRVWELAEEQWLHHTEMVRANPASEISATTLSREFVCRPVVFD